MRALARWLAPTPAVRSPRDSQKDITGVDMAIQVAGAGTLAFTSDRTGDNEIWKMRPNGSGLVQLTNAAGNDYHPNWSRDGTEIIWFATRGQDTNLWIMDGAGGNPPDHFQRVPECASVFFPSGKQILYQCGTASNGYDVCCSRQMARTAWI
ncbi:MAG: hypothetical protein U0163_18110 [Gemmatimonadaceae bacterium]